VAENLLFASGFSICGSMVWELACQAGLFSAHVPVGGNFWEPIPEQCPGGPSHFQHIHELADATFPSEGRSFRGGTFVLANLFAGFAALRDMDACQRQPERMEAHGPFVMRA